MKPSEEAPVNAVECDRTGSFLPPKVEISYTKWN
jgi:endonuclease-3